MLYVCNIHSDVCIYSATLEISEMDLMAASSIVEKNFVTILVMERDLNITRFQLI